SELVSERQMRSGDRRCPEPSQRLGVRLPGLGPRGAERRHYPDLLLDTSTGHRVAVELELTPKSPARLREILGGYGLDSRVNAVLYLVETKAMRATVERGAAQLGLSSLVHVQPVRFASGSGAVGRGRGRERIPVSRGTARKRNPIAGARGAAEPAR
ncbi:MAG: hypothetical protein M3016_04495, partial [Actinomycetota bacterium]|nr:hypothetical protein [Actinomycetota bacterium]